VTVVVRLLSVVIDFALIELLHSIRVPLTLVTLRRVILAGVAVAAFFVVVVAVTVTRLLPTFFGGDTASARTVIAIFVLVMIVISCTANGVRDIFGERRDVVRRSPNRSFFRTLDLTAERVHFIYVVVFSLPVYAGAFLTGAAVAASASEAPAALRATLVIAPIGFFLSHAWVTAALAAGAAKRPVGIFWSFFGFILGGVLGVFSGAFGANIITSYVGDALLHFLEEVTPVLLLIFVTLTVAGVILYPVFARRLRYCGFTLGDKSARRTRLVPLMPRPTLFRGGRREWRADRARYLPQRLLTIAIFAAAASVTWRVAGGPIPENPDVLLESVAGSAAMFVLLGADPFMARHGPRARATQLRVLWEWGVSRTRLVTALSVQFAAFPFTVGLLGAITLIALGVEFVAVMILVVAVATAGAALFSDALIPPTRNSDDSTSTSILSMLVTITVASPVIALVFARQPGCDILAAITAVLIWGVALICFSSRILHRPSFSIT